LDALETIIHKYSNKRASAF